MNDLNRVAGGVAPELEAPLMCECGNKRPHVWEPGEWCSPDRVAPTYWRCVAHMRWVPLDTPCPVCQQEGAADDWPFDDDPPDPL